MTEKTVRAEWAELARRAFISGENIGGDVVEVHRIGELPCPTGRIIACDPLADPNSPSFEQAIPPGVYPIDVSVLDCEGIAFAKLVVEEIEPTRWEIAASPGQEPRMIEELRNGQWSAFPNFGYCVDSGVGSFLDEAAKEPYLAQLDSSESYCEDVLDREWVHRDGWRSNLHHVEADLKVALFSAGCGDGYYQCYFGFVDDRVVCLVTDFGMLGTDML